MTLNGRTTGALFQRVAHLTPVAFVAFRFIIAPFLFVAARDGWNVLFLAGFILACASDLFDGVIARRLGIVTQKLREWDGRADVWFYAWVAAGVWAAYPEVIAKFGWGLLFVLVLQCLSWLLDLVKFRRVTNYHAYSAKLFGLSLFLALVALFASGGADALWWLVILTGTLCMTEEMAMTLILPRWTFDVSGVREALRIRRAEREGQNANH